MPNIGLINSKYHIKYCFRVIEVYLLPTVVKDLDIFELFIKSDRELCTLATEEDFIKSDIGKAEAAILAMESRTIDFVGTGEQQSEAGHKLSASQGSSKGSYNGEFYRDAPNGGYIQYTLTNKDKIATNLAVMCRFTTADKGRVGSI